MSKNVNIDLILISIPVAFIMEYNLKLMLCCFELFWMFFEAGFICRNKTKN